MEIACPRAPAKEASSAAALTVRMRSSPMQVIEDVGAKFFMRVFRGVEVATMNSKLPHKCFREIAKCVDANLPV